MSVASDSSMLALRSLSEVFMSMRGRSSSDSVSAGRTSSRSSSSASVTSSGRDVSHPLRMSTALKSNGFGSGGAGSPCRKASVTQTRSSTHDCEAIAAERDGRSGLQSSSGGGGTAPVRWHSSSSRTPRPTRGNLPLTTP
eukprot:scaffold1226_cov250-Pinguiococcus_pyrenoidosus.AAC.12